MSPDAALFDELAGRLQRVAYRMLGSVADAEDVVQDAWLRWQSADRSEVRVPEAFLRRVVTRLCLDRLKSASARHEDYLGPWLPDPVVEDSGVEDVTLPLMLALERLSPLERAAFLLHDVFGESFDDIAESLGRDPAACRKLATSCPRTRPGGQAALSGRSRARNGNRRGFSGRIASGRTRPVGRVARGRRQPLFRRRRQAPGGCPESCSARAK